jgi:hypothetical protein
MPGCIDPRNNRGLDRNDYYALNSCIPVITTDLLITGSMHQPDEPLKPRAGVRVPFSAPAPPVGLKFPCRPSHPGMDGSSGQSGGTDPGNPGHRRRVAESWSACLWQDDPGPVSGPSELIRRADLKRSRDRATLICCGPINNSADRVFLRRAIFLIVTAYRFHFFLCFCIHCKDRSWAGYLFRYSQKMASYYSSCTNAKYRCLFFFDMLPC